MHHFRLNLYAGALLCAVFCAPAFSAPDSGLVRARLPGSLRPDRFQGHANPFADESTAAPAHFEALVSVSPAEKASQALSSAFSNIKITTVVVASDPGYSVAALNHVPVREGDPVPVELLPSVSGGNVFLKEVTDNVLVFELDASGHPAVTVSIPYGVSKGKHPKHSFQ